MEAPGSGTPSGPPLVRSSSSPKKWNAAAKWLTRLCAVTAVLASSTLWLLAREESQVETIGLAYASAHHTKVARLGSQRSEASAGRNAAAPQKVAAALATPPPAATALNLSVRAEVAAVSGPQKVAAALAAPPPAATAPNLSVRAEVAAVSGAARTTAWPSTYGGGWLEALAYTPTTVSIHHEQPLARRNAVTIVSWVRPEPKERVAVAFSGFFRNNEPGAPCAALQRRSLQHCLRPVSVNAGNTRVVTERTLQS